MEVVGGGEDDEVTNTPLSAAAVFSVPGTTNSGKKGRREVGVRQRGGGRKA